MAHRVEASDLKPFFLSLQQTGFEGDVVVFGSRLTNKSIYQIEQWGARVARFFFPGGHVSNRAARLWPLWKRIFASGISEPAKERLAHGVFHLFYRRHLLYLDFLRKYGSNYANVFLTDCRDVFFQAEPFGWKQGPGLHVFLEEQTNRLGACPHHIRWISSQFGSEMLKEWGDKTVSCAGTVFGDVPAMLDYLSQMVSQTMTAKSLRAADGDQGVHNYLVLKRAFPKMTVHENRNGPVMTLGPVRINSLRFDSDDRVVDRNRRVVPVLHQYDRDPALRTKLLARLNPIKSRPQEMGCS
jgi:hypothetical protein